MNLLRKSLLMVTVMAAALLVAPSQQQRRRIPDDPTSQDGTQFGGLAATNPGLKIRMT